MNFNPWVLIQTTNHFYESNLWIAIHKSDSKFNMWYRFTLISSHCWSASESVVHDPAAGSRRPWGSGVLHPGPVAWDTELPDKELRIAPRWQCLVGTSWVVPWCRAKGCFDTLGLLRVRETVCTSSRYRQWGLMSAITEKYVQQVILNFRPCVQRIVQ